MAMSCLFARFVARSAQPEILDLAFPFFSREELDVGVSSTVDLERCQQPPLQHRPKVCCIQLYGCKR